MAKKKNDAGEMKLSRKQYEKEMLRLQVELSPMDLESYRRWYDYSRARDMMLKATDTRHAPWFIVHSDNKRKARLNCISHLLDLIPHKKAPHKKVNLGKRSDKGRYDDLKTIEGRRLVPERY